jgi:phosphoribosylformylglycinamidine synthase subunit PurQ / glutaminase
MKFGIVTFPGSNCDYDAYRAVVDTLDAEALYLWHKDHDLQGVDVVILPGGFSYGDYLRAGAIARFSPIMREVIQHAERGAPVLGICNGFQILCEAGLLPGVLRPNASLSFVCRDVRVTVERADTVFTARCRPGQTLTVPVKHGEGCYHAPPELPEEHVAFRYAPGENPNGSERDIAGVVNDNGNVLGLMPHPEHAVDPLLGSDDGALLLAGLVDAAREHLAMSLAPAV